MERRRHAPRAHPHARSGDGASDGRPHAALQRSGRRQADVYASDHPQGGAGGPLRWLVSTSLAGAVGAAVIVTAILGWMETQEEAPQRIGADGPRALGRAPDRQAADPDHRSHGGGVHHPRTGAAVPERPRVPLRQVLPALRGAAGARLQGAGRQRAAARPDGAPCRHDAPGAAGSPAGAAAQAAVKIIELFGGTIAGEDGQEIDEREVAAQVASCWMPGTSRRRSGTRRRPAPRRRGQRHGNVAADPCRDAAVQHVVLSKSVFEPEDSAESTAAGHTSSLYASLYHTAQALGIPPEALQQVLKVHATTTDFTRTCAPEMRSSCSSTPRARAAARPSARLHFGRQRRAAEVLPLTHG